MDPDLRDIIREIVREEVRRLLTGTDALNGTAPSALSPAKKRDRSKPPVPRVRRVYTQVVKKP
jgi:hypothetical protein